MSPAIIVFVMEGCPACAEFLPRLLRKARQEGVRVNVYDVQDPYGNQLANEHRIKATPTTIGRCSSGALKRRVGGLDDATLDKFLAALP